MREMAGRARYSNHAVTVALVAPFSLAELIRLARLVLMIGFLAMKLRTQRFPRSWGPPCTLARRVASSLIWAYVGG
ncbi:hypothetical protein B0H63DRAFT_482149 [Podospora didyma]|uniref:Uncharacterized protein n=1 Tax=Podospora didyma TaxID=330526 RepID=A0AAE0N9M9_9PEZI|nr:hypothetical protein B0H63DRAFT_482149 [Podospora didyma]